MLLLIAACMRLRVRVPGWFGLLVLLFVLIYFVVFVLCVYSDVLVYVDTGLRLWGLMRLWIWLLFSCCCLVYLVILVFGCY